MRNAIRLIFITALLFFTGAKISVRGANQYTDSLRKVYDTLTRTDQKAPMAYTIAYGLYITEPVIAQEYSASAIEMYQAIGNKLWQAHSLKLHHYVFLNRQKYDSAFATLYRAKELYAETEAVEFIARAHLDFAHLYLGVRDFDNAGISILEAKKNLSSIENAPEEVWGIFHEYYGRWYWRQGAYKEAIPYYEKAFEQAEQGTLWKVNMALQLASCLRNIEAYEEAYGYLEQVQASESISHLGPAIEAEIDSEKGFLAFDQGKYSKALQFFSLAYDRAAAGQNQLLKLILLNSMAETAIKQKNWDYALERLNIAYHFRDAVIDNKEVDRTYRFLIKAHKGSGNVTLALKYSEERSERRVIADVQEEVRRQESLKASYASMEHQFENEIEGTLAKEQSIHREAQVRYLLGILGLGLIALLVVGVITVWNQRLALRRAELLAQERQVSLSKQEALMTRLEEEKAIVEGELAYKSEELKMILDYEAFKQAVAQAERLGIRKPSKGRNLE